MKMFGLFVLYYNISVKGQHNKAVLRQSKFATPNKQRVLINLISNKDRLIGHICFLSIRLELARDTGSCGEILQRDECDTPRISLSCKLVPVQYREWPLATAPFLIISVALTSVK